MMRACTAASVARTFPFASMCTRACTEGFEGSGLLPPVPGRADPASSGASAWVSRSTEDTAPCCENVVGEKALGGVVRVSAVSTAWGLGESDGDEWVR